MHCSFRVGFFIVRECGRDATTLCAKCGAVVCEAHKATDPLTRKPLSPTLCLKCSPQSLNPSNTHSDTSSSTSSSSTSSRDSFSGYGGEFGGAGASSNWNSVSSPHSSPTMLGALPTNAAVVAASTPNDSIQAAGLSEADANLFDEVTSFDEADNDRNTYDS